MEKIKMLREENFRLGQQINRERRERTVNKQPYHKRANNRKTSWHNGPAAREFIRQKQVQQQKNRHRAWAPNGPIQWAPERPSGARNQHNRAPPPPQLQQQQYPLGPPTVRPTFESLPAQPAHQQQPQQWERRYTELAEVTKSFSNLNKYISKRLY